MDNARLTAEAIADGLNCLHELGLLLRKQGGHAEIPSSDCIEILCAMEQAFETIRVGNLVTDMVVSDKQRTLLRQVRALVDDWIRVGQGANELVGVIEALLKSLMPTEPSAPMTDR